MIDEGGLNTVSLRAVARHLGVSEAAPYHHFKNKGQLLTVLTTRAYAGLHERMLHSLSAAGVDPFDRLAALARAYVNYGLESRGRFKLMFGAHMPQLAQDPELYAAGHPTRVLLSEAVGACVLPSSKIDPATLELTSWALAHGLAWLIAEQEITFDDPREADGQIAAAINLLVGGVRALQA